MAKTKTSDEKPVCRQVTRGLVSNVGLAFQSMSIVPGNVEAPFWIGDQGPFPANETLPMRNALVHLPKVETGDLVEVERFMMAPDAAVLLHLLAWL